MKYIVEMMIFLWRNINIKYFAQEQKCRIIRRAEKSEEKFLHSGYLTKICSNNSGKMTFKIQKNRDIKIKIVRTNVDRKRNLKAEGVEEKQKGKWRFGGVVLWRGRRRWTGWSTQQKHVLWTGNSQRSRNDLGVFWTGYKYQYMIGSTHQNMMSCITSMKASLRHTRPEEIIASLHITH